MKRILMVMLGLWTINAMAQGQDKEKLTTQERTEILTEWMQEELTLTQEQLPKVKVINQEFAEGMEEVISTSGVFAKMKKFRTQEEKRDKALEKVLTPQQYDTFMDIKGNLRKEMKERGAKKKQS